MLDLQRSIKKIIERFIVNKTPITDAVSKGDKSIPIQSSRRYECEDEIVIFNQPSMDQQAEGEVHKITDVPDNNTITIDEPLIENYSLSNSFVEKMVAGNFLQSVHIGSPEVISHFPSITIDATSETHEWLTLESTSGDFNIDITVYTQAENFETQYESMMIYAKAIKNALFKTFYPLVEPFDETTLVNDVPSDNNLIKIADEDLLLCKGSGWIFLESFDYLRSTRVKRYLGNGIYELIIPTTQDFEAGDKVIRPLRHFYNSIPATIQYGTVVQQSMLKAATISYQAREETRRYVPFPHGLTV